MRTIVYVDAFNLYYGALKGTGATSSRAARFATLRESP